MTQPEESSMTNMIGFRTDVATLAASRPAAGIEIDNLDDPDPRVVAWTYCG
jgi:hypothetical protein